MEKFAVILPAAGRSTRFGDPKQKKIYAELDGRAVWLRAVEPFVNRDDVAQIIMAIAGEDRELFERRYRPSVAFMNITIVEGGDERSDTVARALEVVHETCDYVAVHDAARPCLSAALIEAVFAAAKRAWGRTSGHSRFRDDQAGRRWGIHGRDSSPRGAFFGSDSASLQAQPALRGIRPALANRGPAHRRLPAHRGAGPPLCDCAGLAAEYQDHHTAGSEGRGCLPAALGKAAPRVLGSSVSRRPGEVERATQAQAFGSFWLVVAFHLGSSSIDQSVGSIASAQSR